ncbi:MAG: hypothetical protein sL5_07060 [Candidatus Mesenet longicola]|uniref:Uncharacterized protein n=1 Tax=Candidatus Mesenet longicola TaxID=1892558 RepID=A0A8J3HQF1_9RICK|nr:MAG: hypothetical protein sGL2_07440 [Candidatus Mesenet longicola]GHM59713.1 MAG: hypothetical protein sL5_07060 [Candidatus Mesenet longicola]
MSEVCLSKSIISQPQEDGDSIFLGKIRLEDLQNEDLTRQLEEKCDELLKQNLLKESESEIELDELLDSVDIIDNELDKEFDKKLGINEVFWKKVLKLLNFFNGALNLNLDLKLEDELVLTKEKQKRKNLLFSFLDAIRKKFFKKELTLEEMLKLQIEALEEQLSSENDPEIVSQIKKQLEFLMELKDKLFELSLEQSLNRTTEWLLTIGAMQTVTEMAGRAKEIITTKGQWKKVDDLLSYGKFVGQISGITQNNKGVENIKTKPFMPVQEQNNNLNLIPLSQNIAKDNSGFLKLLYTLLALANVYAAKHMELGMGGETETTTQKGFTAVKASCQTQKQIPVERDGKERKILSAYNENQDARLQISKKQPNSLMQEVNLQELKQNQSRICGKKI